MGQLDELPGAVLWRSHAVAPVESRVLPDGCIDVIWSSRDGLFVAGPDTVAQLATMEAGESMVGLRLPPGVGPAVLGVAARELTDRRVDLDTLWPARLVRELTERAGTGDAGAVLHAAAAGRLDARGGPDRDATAITALVSAGRTVADTAEAIGLSERHLLRRCADLFGYGPKTLGRILRLHRALALLDRGLPAAEAAATAGYADQPHLSREVRTLAGVPLGVLRTPPAPVPVG